MKLDPPTRISVSTCAMVQGSGTNHCFINSGSVHALKSFSRGASMSLVRTSSRLWVVSVGLVSVLMVSCLIVGYYSYDERRNEFRTGDANLFPSFPLDQDMLTA